jgi:hypothetical protein
MTSQDHRRFVERHDAAGVRHVVGQGGQGVLYGGDGPVQRPAGVGLPPTRTSRRRSAVDQHDTWIGPQRTHSFLLRCWRGLGRTCRCRHSVLELLNPMALPALLPRPDHRVISGQTARDGRRAASASRSAISRWLLQETLGGGWTGGGKSRVWFAPEGCVSSAALPSAVRWRQLVCQSGRSGLACSQSTKVASSQ